MPKRNGTHQPKSGAWIRAEKRLAIYIRDRFTCLYCGSDLRGYAPADVTLDHVISRGEWVGATGGCRRGMNEPTNLVAACKPCNSSRGSRPIEDFAPGGALARVFAQLELPLNLDLAKALIAGRAGDPAVEVR